MQAAVNEPVNLGNPQEMTLLELAKRILRLTGRAQRDRLPAAARGRSQGPPAPNITRRAARALLGWEPRVDTDEGLKLTLEWFHRGRLRRRSRWQMRKGGASVIDEELRAILVCPACKGKPDLRGDAHHLSGPAARPTRSATEFR